MMRYAWYCDAARLSIATRLLGRALATLGIAPTKSAVAKLAN